jgi:hypothetical protein
MLVPVTGRFLKPDLSWIIPYPSSPAEDSAARNADTIEQLLPSRIEQHLLRGSEQRPNPLSGR